MGSRLKLVASIKAFTNLRCGVGAGVAKRRGGRREEGERGGSREEKEISGLVC